MARVGLCRLNSEGVEALQARYRQSRWTNVAAFCNAIGIPRSTYYELIGRETWFEIPTILDKLTAIGIPQADQADLCEFREVDPLLATLNNLPLQPTSFVGRETEKETLKQMLNSSPLLTLTGSGGCGKTRLALEVGAELLQDFPQGVWLVELASLTDPDLVDQALLAALGLREEAGRSAIETALTHLKSRQLLLILDNCEHLVGACAHLANALLRSCAGVKLLATSRTPLQVGGETVWRVPSLPAPEPDVLESEKEPWGVVLEYDACRLFVERARGHRSYLEMSRSSAVSVAGICARLDGIPLAIELAAARVRMLSVEEIEGRLDQRFRLLIGGSRTVLARHQTLRALIDWSWELLEAPEKSLLSRLSVFAGGWTLEAAEQVCSDFGFWILDFGVSSAPSEGTTSGSECDQHNKFDFGNQTPDETSAIQNPKSKIRNQEVLDLLGSLVDKSLVVAETRGETTRYRLLETVRQYARDRLAESGENRTVGEQHRDYFLQWTLEIKPKLRSSEQAHWFSVLEQEHDNLRAAITFCLEEPQGAVKGLSLCVALEEFWWTLGYLSEGRERLATLLPLHSAQEHTAARWSALNTAGTLAEMQGDYASARSLLEESLTIARELGDRLRIAVILGNLGNLAHQQGDYALARTLQQEYLAMCQVLEYKRGIANALNSLANLAWAQGDFLAVRSLQEECLAIRRELGDMYGIAVTLANMGIFACHRGDYTSALPLLEESLATRRELGDKRGIAHSLASLGQVAHARGDDSSAHSLYEESLGIAREVGDKKCVVTDLHALGSVACYRGDYVSARSLLDESLSITQELGNKTDIATSLNWLGIVARRQGEVATAHSLHEESLAIRIELEDRPGIADCFEAFASLALKEKTVGRAARLWAAASALRERIGSSKPPNEREDYDKEVVAMREALGEAAFAVAWEEGRAMMMEQVAAYALEETLQ